jgi:hypothetical protein
MSAERTGDEFREERRQSYSASHDMGLMLGQMAVTHPQFGELRLYQKRNENLGAQFVSEDTGSTYGVSGAVTDRLEAPSRHEGWGYVNIQRLTVFYFRAQSRQEVPPDSLAIWWNGINLAVHPSLHKKLTVSDGRWVAFRAQKRLVGDTGRERIRVSALFPVDIEHPGLLVNLVSGQVMNARDHVGLIGELLGGLDRGAAGLSNHVRVQWPDALTAMASLEGLSEELQALARALRTRLASGPDVHAAPCAPPQRPQGAAAPSGSYVPPLGNRPHGIQKIDIDL